MNLMSFDPILMSFAVDCCFLSSMQWHCAHNLFHLTMTHPLWPLLVIVFLHCVPAAPVEVFSQSALVTVVATLLLHTPHQVQRDDALAPTVKDAPVRRT